jgi:hypothetical protein
MRDREEAIFSQTDRTIFITFQSFTQTVSKNKAILVVPQENKGRGARGPMPIMSKPALPVKWSSFLIGIR